MNDLDNLMANYSRWEFQQKATELYIFLLPKLNTGLSVKITQVEEMNGFDLWRMINREEDPMKQDAGLHIEVEIQSTGGQKCRNIKETKALMMKLEAKSK